MKQNNNQQDRKGNNQYSRRSASEKMHPLLLTPADNSLSTPNRQGGINIPIRTPVCIIELSENLELLKRLRERHPNYYTFLQRYAGQLETKYARMQLE